MQLSALSAFVVVAGALADLLSYHGFASARITDEAGRTFNIYVNGSRPTLLLEPRLGTALSGQPSKWPLPYWRHAAESFVAPLGCGISEIRAIAVSGAAWEATYVCPATINLPALVAAQRPQLLAGAPLHP